MHQLKKIIIEKIRKQGPISFETFMEMALYYPSLGYYANPDTTIGKSGDYYTSPHLHSIFGAMIARQLMEMWEHMGRPATFHAVEMGAGTGYLCKDIFDYLLGRRNDTLEFVRSLHYVIIEPFEHFEKRQRALLGTLINDHDVDITWTRSLKNISTIQGCIFSNELLDAFPVHLIEIRTTPQEVFIDCNKDDIVEILQEVNDDYILYHIKNISLSSSFSYRTEFNTRIKTWIQDITDVLSEGFLMTIDYGYSAREYYSEGRSRGTLLCYYNHMLNENIYENIGQQDITAHVNFSSLKKWGEEMDLKTVGYCAQGTFLTAVGIDRVIKELYSQNQNYLFEISKIKGLLFPQGMGESHRVMIQYRGDNVPALSGFSLRNQIASL